MADKSSIYTDSSELETCSIYKKGGPFHKLTKREYYPYMNVLKTFNAEHPNHLDFTKDESSKSWAPSFCDTFLLILKDVDDFLSDWDITTCQTAAIYEIFYSCFNFMVLVPAMNKERCLQFFRNTLVLYCVQDPPESLRIFNGIQAFDISKLFHNLIANNYEMMEYVLMTEHTVEFDVVKDL